MANDSVIEVTEYLIPKIIDIRPHVIGTGVYIWNETYISHLFQKLSKQLMGTKPIVILGGPQITYGFKGLIKILND